MHTGDNMLAIYASEKALRLAERLGEAAAASRAHGIFGRVFGRIGDSERARENLERSVELARESDPAEAVRALFALGYHLEVSEAEYDRAPATPTTRRSSWRCETGDLPSQVEVHAALAQLAVYRGDWEAAERETEASATLAEREGLAGKLCFPYSMRGVLRWHEGDLDGRRSCSSAPSRSPSRSGRSEVAFESLHWLATALRDRGDHADADQTLARALDLCERAGLVAQSVEATAARAVNLALWGKRRGRRARSPRRRRAWPSGCATRSAGPRASRRRGRDAAPTRASATGCSPRPRAAWTELGRPLDAERCARLASSPGAPAG